jgi:hypothetical protein
MGGNMKRNNKTLIQKELKASAQVKKRTSKKYKNEQNSTVNNRNTISVSLACFIMIIQLDGLFLATVSFELTPFFHDGHDREKLKGTHQGLWSLEAVA